MVRGFVSLFNCKRENHGEQDLSGVYTGYIRRFNLQHWWGIAERSGVNAACRLRVVMRENLMGILASLALLIGCAQAQSSLAPALEWPSAATKQTLNMAVLKPEEYPTNQALPLVVYLENLAAPRVGTDGDEAIIHDFMHAGFLVVTLDYARHPQARVPALNRDLLEIRNEVLHKTFLLGIEIDPTRVFLVPAGSRLRRDVVFYREPGRTLAMDIIYPSHPAQPVGAVMEFSCDNQNRMGDGSLVSCSDTILDGEAAEGFAVAMADHPVKAPYKGLDPMPDCAWKIKAAVRTLRLTGAELGFNGKIAPVGFSRGSGMALMLITTKGMEEFEGHGENTNSDSDVQGAIVMSGRFTYLDLLPNDHMLPRYAASWGDRAGHLEVWRREGALDYLSGATLPLFLTINCSEGPDAQLQMATLRKHLAELGSDEIFMLDHKPRGHKVTVVPDILSAMDRYLKSRLN
jgi:hypothetical protein